MAKASACSKIFNVRVRANAGVAELIETEMGDLMRHSPGVA